MIFLLIKHLRDSSWLTDHGLDFLRVFTFVTFQATVAVLLSFVLCIASGSRVVAWLRRMKIGDSASFDQADMDKLMSGKKGTPTMGGILIIGAITITTLLLADLTNFYVQMALVCLLWLGGVGHGGRLAETDRGAGGRGVAKGSRAWKSCCSNWVWGLCSARSHGSTAGTCRKR